LEKTALGLDIKPFLGGGDAIYLETADYPF
jgi:hypothetical protein